MRIVTWNINSVRIRLNHVEKMIKILTPDLICLQEIKVESNRFPVQLFNDLGYPLVHVKGIRKYNGVAIISRRRFETVGEMIWCRQADARHIFARVSDGPTVRCLYVPSGGDVPDPSINPKFAHKLSFLEEQVAWWQTTHRPDHPLVLAGDLNVAPGEHDVWSHTALLDVVSHTPVEVAALERLRATIDWVDIARTFVPADQKLYSWWSYRARDWRTSNRGRRLDHIWLSPALSDAATGFGILDEARSWQPKPSDHVPVWVDLEETPSGREPTGT